MSANYIIEEKADKYNKQREENLLEEAAIHVINGMSRDVAIKHVTEIGRLREEAEIDEHVTRDENGFVVQYLDSQLNEPSKKGINQKQLYAVYKELCEREGI